MTLDVGPIRCHGLFRDLDNAQVEIPSTLQIKISPEAAKHLAELVNEVNGHQASISVRKAAAQEGETRKWQI